VGDVWKHLVLREVLAAASAGDSAVAYFETHAGEGQYRLADTGEWREGIGKLWDRHVRDAGVARYVAACRAVTNEASRPHVYPGSPLLAADVLGSAASITLWERDPEACRALQSCVGHDARVAVHAGDGMAALGAARTATVVLVDPPWSAKDDWTRVPDAVITASRAMPRASLLLWYPIKSLTRPNAMLARFERAGVAATVAELVTTPLEHQRNRLNGSGVLLVRPPHGVVARIGALAPDVGDACATQAGAWALRVKAWGGQ
jgi:23S rRNA (adenine2030-N6)-methyltransferase